MLSCLNFYAVLAPYLCLKNHYSLPFHRFKNYPSVFKLLKHNVIEKQAQKLPFIWIRQTNILYFV